MLQKAKNYVHLLRAMRAVKNYQRPADSLTVIGVTGTDGKTTTASLIYHILQQAGYKAALISTVAAYIGTKKIDTGFHVSTPDSRTLQSYISQIKKAGAKYLVLEVTSHALDQHRVYGIPFAVGVLTNVSHEHLDYHKSMQNYLKAKAKLLQMAKVAVLNRDDSSYSEMTKLLSDKKIITYGLRSQADVTCANHPFSTTLPGEFNQSNILAALSVADVLTIDPHIAAKAVSTFSLPEGRIDTVYDKEFKIIIDFAHTPNALKQVLTMLRTELKSGRVISVFGSAGKRDESKRPIMGKVASELADIIILTSEDPRDESTEYIAENIRAGMPKNRENVSFIADRQEAITKAVSLAHQGDVVVITGKGHEKSLNMGDGEEKWSDYEAVVRALKVRNKK